RKRKRGQNPVCPIPDHENRPDPAEERKDAIPLPMPHRSDRMHHDRDERVVRVLMNPGDQREPRRSGKGDAQAPDLVEPEVGEEAAKAQENAEEQDRRERCPTQLAVCASPGRGFRWSGTGAATCRSAGGTAGGSSSPSRSRSGGRSATRAGCPP